jgi:DnaK suppressor protein
MLSDEKKKEFKERLLQMKTEAENQMEEYHADQAKEDYENDRTGEISSVADHPGDQGTDQFERAKEQTFYEQAREKIMEVEDALQRMEEGRYGVSEKSGEPIPVERLEAMPTARYKVEEAEKMNQ